MITRISNDEPCLEPSSMPLEVLRSHAPHGFTSCNKISGVEFLRVADKTWSDRSSLIIGSADDICIKPSRIETVSPGGGWWEGEFEACNSTDWAQLSTTSGTTGAPKWVIHSREAISDTIERLATHMEINSTIREYIGVPVTFSFGLGRARLIAMCGGAAFLPDNGFRPDEISSMLRDGAINALSAVPTMLRTILAKPDLIGSSGKNLKWLEIGSQFMDADEKKKLITVFPNAIILQHYGLTEASRSTFLRIDEVPQNILGSVGRAVGHTRMRIGHGGKIEISGPHVASGVIQNGALSPLADAEGWLCTSDLGKMRGGWLYFLGRSDDVANIGGVKVSVEHFEHELSDLVGGTSDLAVCVIKDPLRGEKLAIAYLEGLQADIAQRTYELLGKFGLRKADVTLLELDSIPRTETGKVRRKHLADAIMEASLRKAESGGSTFEVPDSQVMSEQEAVIAAIWREAIGIAEVGRHDNFHDLGGDSLSAISVMIRAEQSGLPSTIIRRMLAGETVAQIANALDGGNAVQATDPRTSRADGLNAVRGLFALLIVVSHWGPFFAERTGDFGALIWNYVSPVLRIGTPGFAMIYGMGLGLFFYRQLDNNEARVKSRFRRNSMLVTFGVLLIGAAQAWRLLLSEQGFGPIWPEILFYEVLLFYAFMIPTSLFWLKLIARSADPIFASIVLVVASYSTYLICVWAMPTNISTGWTSLGWHMLVAPYSYLRLLGAVALGLAFSLWSQNAHFKGSEESRLAQFGFALGAIGSLLVASVPGGWANNAGEIIAIPAFAGLVILAYSAALGLSKARSSSQYMRIAKICGLLAFPIFIGHGIVIPLKEVLVSYGSSEIVAIAVPVSLFILAMALLGRRLYRLMFAPIINL
jgi:peptidoglycan/LPS O-acetylase OafA/YrhL